ncbi:hypothetical protein HEP87_41030 [Streptomyces sp. S1D4-11]|nr:hypothetical protein [Streptomyces sp. S1D4-11]QIY99169.1 hypothetical protein HEP87_41030 [Streptomyces sp. S1D4-11]
MKREPEWAGALSEDETRTLIELLGKLTAHSAHSAHSAQSDARYRA